MFVSVTGGAAVLFLCFISTSCAPLQKACADVQRSSMDLYDIVRNLSSQNGSKDETDPNSSPIDWMRAKDMCDPSSLKEKTVCVEKMHHVLTSYRTKVASLAKFKSSCLEFAGKLMPTMKKLQEDMSACLKSSGWTEPSEGSIVSEEMKPTKQWEADVLCHYTMKRLFSFSILAARVFAVGDPAGHGAAQSVASCATVG